MEAMPSSTSRPKIASRIADGLHRFQRATAEEHRKPAEESLLGRVEESVTPVDGAAKSLLTGRQVAGAAGQQVEAAFQARQHGGRREQLDARRRQFDGEGQTVEASADGSDSGRVFIGQGEVVLHGTRAFHKKRDRGKA